MSTTSLRALAVTVAAIIAVLTGIATGLLSGSQTCTVTPGTAPPATAAAPTTHSSPSTPAGAGIGDAIAGTTSPAAGGVKPAAPTTNAPQLGSGPATCNTDGFDEIPALTAFAGTAFVGGALLLLLLLASRGRRTNIPVSAPPASTRPVSAPPAPTRANSRADADRTTLVQAIIYVRDRVTSKALADRLGAALRDAGVDILEPTGVRFDPAHHEAGGSAPSDDPAKIGSIAAVEVPGYADRGGRILRPPVVTVYQGSNYGRPGQNRGSSSRDRTRGEQQR